MTLPLPESAAATLMGRTPANRPAMRPRPARQPWFEYQRPLSTPVRILLGAASVLGFLLIWQLAASWGSAGNPLLPSPPQVLATLLDLFLERGFTTDVLSSLQRILLSFALAALIALPLGVLMGAFRVVEATFNPLVAAFRYLPAPAFIPLLLMWLGTGDSQKIALLMLGVVWFLATLVCDATKQIPSDYIECSRTLGAGRAQVLFRIVVPFALPGIVDTCRQMLAVSWTYLVIAEIVAATDGIGAMMMRARRFVHVDEIMAGILVIGALGLLCDLAFRFLHWILFPYLRRT